MNERKMEGYDVVQNLFFSPVRNINYTLLGEP